MVPKKCPRQAVLYFLDTETVNLGATDRTMKTYVQLVGNSKQKLGWDSKLVKVKSFVYIGFFSAEFRFWR